MVSNLKGGSGDFNEVTTVLPAMTPIAEKFIAEANAQGEDSPRMAFLIVTERRSQRRCGESPRVKLQRVSSEDRRTPVCGQAVKQSAVMRSALEFFATTQSCRERGGALISSWRPGAKLS